MNYDKVNLKMKEKGISIYKLANLIGYDRTNLKKLLLGKICNPRIDTVIKIAKAFNLTIDEFAELCGYRKGDENGLSQQNCSKKQ